MSDDALSLLFRLVSYLTIALELVAAVVAVAKLRATPSGILLALGLGGIGLKSLMYTVVFAVAIRPALSDGRYEEVEATMTALTLSSNGAGMLGWTLIGVGGALLPSSLKRLAER
ncbi:MAG: hypothetical protein KF729_15865 [Sandaracinaceae bacterium]|nr:hypothetical protein [Sandaracinaceae bacterium]